MYVCVRCAHYSISTGWNNYTANAETTKIVEQVRTDPEQQRLMQLFLNLSDFRAQVLKVCPLPAESRCTLEEGKSEGRS